MPGTIVFDAYGTLFDVNAAVIRLRGEIGPSADRLAELWRAKQLEYTWVRSLANRYRDFQALTEEALDFASARCGGLEPELRARLLDAYADIDPYPDTLPTLARLKRDGWRTATLSNATDAMLARAVAAARLGPVLDVLISVDALRIYKTDPRAYRLAAERLGEPAQGITFVSSNRWDVAGAAAFGFDAIWLNRAKAPDEYTDLAPGRVIGGLDALFGPDEPDRPRPPDVF